MVQRWQVYKEASGINNSLNLKMPSRKILITGDRPTNIRFLISSLPNSSTLHHEALPLHWHRTAPRLLCRRSRLFWHSAAHAENRLRLCREKPMYQMPWKGSCSRQEFRYRGVYCKSTGSGYKECDVCCCQPQSSVLRYTLY